MAKTVYLNEKMRNYIALLIAVTIISFSAIAQKPVPRIVPFDEFVSDDGYKNIEAYDIEVDSRGYIIIASNYGFSKFNGYQVRGDFELNEKGLMPNLYALYKDYYGDIWTGGRGIIAHFKGDSIMRYPVPDSIVNLGLRGFESIYYDKNGLLHIAPRNHGYFTVDQQGKVTEVMSRRTHKIRGIVVTQLDDGSWLHFSLTPPELEDSTLSVYFLDGNNGLQKITETDCFELKYESALVSHKDGSMSLSVGTDFIVRFNGSKLINVKKFDFEIIKLFVDSRNDLWIGTLGQGAYQAKNSDLSNLTKYCTGNFAAVTESHDGGIWFKSDKIGLGYLPPTSGVHYSDQNGYGSITDIYFTRVINSKVFFSTKDWDLYSLENGEVKEFLPQLNEGMNSTRVVCYDQNEEGYWVWINDKLYSVANYQIKNTIDLETTVLDGEKRVRLKNVNGRVLGITNSILFEVVNNEVIILSDDSTRGRLWDFTLGDSGRFWFASEIGIQFLDGRSIKSAPFDQTDNLNIATCFSQDDYLWAISDAGSLIRFNSDSAEFVSDQDGNPCKGISFSSGKKGTIWGYDLEAAKLMRLSDLSNPEGVTRENFCLPLNENGAVMFGGFVVFNNQLVIGSNQQLSIIPIDQLQKEPFPSKLLVDIFVNYEPVAFSNSYELEYLENDIRLEFDAIGFSRRTIIFSYMLEGYDSQWNDTENKELRYTNLSPGTYKLKLRSKLQNGNWTQPEIITFVIKAPFWQTLTFKLLMIALGLLLILGIVLLRVRFVRKKEREKSRNLIEKTHLEMRALKSQLNPHFIFNSISSAMFYISKNENDKAESYLQRFTKLIRGILENSDEKSVTIVEEVQLMKHYVSLESEQFEGQPIHFDVLYEDVDPEMTKIPPTILQPYIENSIRHGLKTKEGIRKISLSFQQLDDQLEVKIVDNGIGREESKKRDTRESHKSFGMLISSRRIALLNEDNASKLKITDLYDSDGFAAGTRVNFSIPLNRVNIE